MRFDRLAGLAGVAADETLAARTWAKRLEWPMLLVATWIPIQWYFEQSGVLSPPISYGADWIVWLFFVVETTVLAALTRDKRRYLLGNWMNVAIISAGLPLLWDYTPLAGILRSLRLVLLASLLTRVSHTLRSVLAQNRLGYTLGVAAVLVIFAGVMISTIDPSIESPWDGIWWALVTVTTVGYGDVVPQSPGGRIFAAFLILLGVGLFALLAANFSAFLIGMEAEKEEIEMRGRLRDIQVRLDRLEKRLDVLVARAGAEEAAGEQEKESTKQ